jgi:hypothetical protein
MKIPKARRVYSHLLGLEITKPNDKEWYDKAEAAAESSRKKFIELHKITKLNKR